MFVGVVQILSFSTTRQSVRLMSQLSKTAASWFRSGIQTRIQTKIQADHISMTTSPLMWSRWVHCKVYPVDTIHFPPYYEQFVFRTQGSHNSCYFCWYCCCFRMFQASYNSASSGTIKHSSYILIPAVLSTYDPLAEESLNWLRLVYWPTVCVALNHINHYIKLPSNLNVSASNLEQLTLS